MTKKLISPVLTQGKIKTHEVTAEDSNNQTPVFCFEYMVDGFCVRSCQTQEKAQFAESLHRRGKMTWHQLRVSPRHGLGFEIIDRKSIKVGLPRVVTDDVNIIAFRCIGLRPMIGYRHGRIFHILWVDPKGRVYDHGN